MISKYVPDGGLGRDRSGNVYDLAGLKETLHESVRQLDLPQFPLDDLIQKLGGPNKVRDEYHYMQTPIPY